MLTSMHSTLSIRQLTIVLTFRTTTISALYPHYPPLTRLTHFFSCCPMPSIELFARSEPLRQCCLRMLIVRCHYGSRGESRSLVRIRILVISVFGRFHLTPHIGSDAGPSPGGPNQFSDGGGSAGILAMGWGSGTTNFTYLVSVSGAPLSQWVKNGGYNFSSPPLFLASRSHSSTCSSRPNHSQLALEQL